jgi:hypothetical protein
MTMTPLFLAVFLWCTGDSATTCNVSINPELLSLTDCQLLLSTQLESAKAANIPVATATCYPDVGQGV